MGAGAGQVKAEWTEQNLGQSLLDLKAQHDTTKLISFLEERIADEHPVSTSNRAKLWNELGLAMLGQENQPQAENCFQEALKVDPEQSNARYNLATLMLQQDQLQAALEHYQLLLEVEPDHFPALFNAALCHTHSNNIETARPLFLRAAKIEPDNSSAQFWAGESLIYSGHYSEATPYFERAYALNPQHFETVIGYAATLLETKQFSKAVSLCDQALMSFGPAVLPLQIKADALLALDRVDEATMCHLDLHHIDLDSRDFLVTRIRRLETEEPEKMDQYAKIILERNPGFEEILSTGRTASTAGQTTKHCVAAD